MTFTLQQIAKLMDIEYKGEDCPVNGFSTDSRTLMPGDLFIAISGERVNGHAFIKEVEERGAAALLVSEPVETKLPKLTVSNTILALGVLAKNYRKQFELPLCAITGSCGKTTVKEMVVSILSQKGPMLATRGNLNTEIGVPLTLLGLKSDHHFAVVEMGARKKGDIAYLVSLADPSVSLITNAGVAHVEIFGSVDNIAKAKGEIFSGLIANGTAIINEEDKHADYWRSLLKEQTVLGFGYSKGSVMCVDLEQTLTHSTFVLQIKSLGSISIHLPVPGFHNVQNALAAAAVSIAMGASLEDIKEGLSQFKPVSGRLQFKKGVGGTQIIDDTYNANPASMRAALSVLAQYPGKKIYVMGDMFELGEKAPLLHEQIGEQAKKLGIDLLMGVGTLTEKAVAGFGKGATHYANKPALLEALNRCMDDTTTILIKGSRGMRMEEIVLALTETGIKE